MDVVPLSLYQDDWVQKCFSVASYTCLVYDHALTIDREIEFIWQAPWTFTKAVFLLNRYGNLACQTAIQFVRLLDSAHHTAESCDLPNEFRATYIVCAMESIHILVLLRAWAIWGCRRRVAVMLIGSYLVYFLFFLVKSTFTTISVTTRTFKYPGFPELCVTVIPPNSWVLCVASGFQDTVVFAVTMISLWRHSKNSRDLYPTSLLFVLVRDAVIFYAVSLFYAVFNTVTWIVYPSNPKNMLFLTFAVNLLSIAGQRFVLNLRGFTVRTYGSRSLSAEVDRQLGLFSGTQRLEWWATSTGEFGDPRGRKRGKKEDWDVGMDVDSDTNRQSSSALDAIMMEEDSAIEQ